MTTCVYANNVLATDSRATYASTFNTNDSRLKCCHCHTSTDRYRDNSTKLLLPKGVTYNDEPVLAIAHAGSVKSFDYFKKLIERYKKIDELDQLSQDFSGRPAFSSMCLIAVTASSVYKMAWDGEDCEVEQYGRDAIVTSGSGGMVAKSALIVNKNTDAIGSILYAGVVDEGTGGDIVFVEFSAIDPAKHSSMASAPVVPKDHILAAFRADQLNVKAFYAPRTETPTAATAESALPDLESTEGAVDVKRPRRVRRSTAGASA